jgi:hypothetical protein
MRTLIFSVLLLVGGNLKAQDYVKEGKNRLNFAKTYFELGMQYSPSFTGKKILSGGETEQFTNGALGNAQLNIGGIHFWGHADFYISIPLSQMNFKKRDSTSFILSESVVTGARFMPWAYKDKRITPYVGARWSIVNFKQELQPDATQPLFSKSKINVEAGVLFGKGNLMARAGASYYPTHKWNYPLNETNFQQVKTPWWSLTIGIIYAFESTRSKKYKKLNDEFNAYPTRSSPTLHSENHGDWFIGIGPSSSFMLSVSDYNKEMFPFFNKKPVSNTYLDISLGYQFNRVGLVTALSFRNPQFTYEGYGVTQTIGKRSLLLEAFKFLTDYSGFTPYIGINIAIDNISYSESGRSSQFSLSTSRVTPGVTAGWDILPGKTAQPFVLRTNLRWFPFESIQVKGKSFSLNQIEYNVIQAVFYPSRLKRIKSKTS